MLSQIQNSLLKAGFLHARNACPNRRTALLEHVGFCMKDCKVDSKPSSLCKMKKYFESQKMWWDEKVSPHPGVLLSLSVALLVFPRRFVAPRSVLFPKRSKESWETLAKQPACQSQEESDWPWSTADVFWQGQGYTRLYSSYPPVFSEEYIRKAPLSSQGKYSWTLLICLCLGHYCWAGYEK